MTQSAGRLPVRHRTPIDAMLLDGMHPANAGHERVAELLIPAIRAALR